MLKIRDNEANHSFLEIESDERRKVGSEKYHVIDIKNFHER